MSESTAKTYRPGDLYKKLDVVQHPRHGVMIILTSNPQEGKMTAMVEGQLRTFIQNREYVESIDRWIIKNEDEIDD